MIKFVDSYSENSWKHVVNSLSDFELIGMGDDDDDDDDDDDFPQTPQTPPPRYFIKDYWQQNR